MRKNYRINHTLNKLLFCMGLLIIATGLVKAQTISGTVNSSNGTLLPGVSVTIKGTTEGTLTDGTGKYSLKVQTGKTLVFSFIGYEKQEVTVANASIINITLKESSESLDEVVVTGVFDKRTALESSIAISTLDSKQIDRIASNSAADLLSYTPGVYVNSSVGEINNTVYSRGVNANQFAVAGGNGYYYVALMEDGLPTTNVSSGNIVADYFYRADATMSRLESVRGGSASITGNNSPGGIFNYVSKTGLNAQNEISYKVGLEGNGVNLYNRLDFSYGGKINKSDWAYNVGGFYRASQGPRNPGYLLNNGGQIKANIIKSLKNGGFIKIYGKYLNDKNALPQALPAQNYQNPQIAQGFSNTDTYMLPAAASTQPLWGTDKSYVFNPANLSHSTDLTLGSEMNLILNNGWTLNNNIKGSIKNVEQDLTIMSTPTSLDNLLTYALMGIIMPGTISLTDRATGQQLASVNADFSRGPSWSVTSNKLPGQNILQDGVLFNFTSYSKTQVSELIDQISLNKKVGKHSLTFGSYLAFSHVITDPNGTGNTSLRPIQNLASPLDIKLTLPGGGPTLQVTDPNGYAQLSGGRFSFNSYDVKQNQTSFFFADGIQASSNINVDLGVRFDNISVNGSNNIGVENPNSNAGGVDKNPLTLYDNYYFVKGTNVPYNSSLNMLSFSAGINYKIDNHSSVYGRFSNGQKAPDLQFYFDNYSTLQASPTVKAQTVTQIEVGYKFKSPRASGSIIPFYSKLSNIPVSSIGQDTNNVAYFTPVVYNSIRTLGVEAETNINLSKHFSINANLTIQSSKAVSWQSWVMNNNGRADDQLVNNNGNTAENVPAIMYNITPSYNFNKGYLALGYRYMGKREANMANAFELPGFGQLNLFAGYDISKKLSITGNINNLANTLGIMNWMASSQYALVNAFSHNSTTADFIAQNPKSIFQIVPVQPRAFFLTLKYKF